jgi:RecQ family ATP-dependent DNA helicase
VRNDICTLLRLQSPYECVTGYDRPNLYFEVRQPKKRDDELLSLLHARRDISGIVYCATRKNVDKVCDLLRKDGHAAARYHAGLPDALRQAAQDDFQHDRAQVMVATNAFGMGIDKSNVGYVIHYNMPRNLESYYQEAGRAGRDGSRADCILLYAKQDVVLGRWMIDHAEVNPDMTAEQRAAVRESELERLKLMTWYATGRKCLRHTVLAYFGESSGKHCGNCSVCCGVSPLGVREKPVTPVSAREEPLFAALRLLRNTIAKSLKVPAYVVLTDASLRDMAVRKPRDMATFLQVSGVGEVKCSRFGPAFLRYLSMLDGQDIAGLQLTELAQEAAALVGRGKAGTGV